VQSFRCPRCGELAADLRQGRELEIESIELEEPEPGETQPMESEVGVPNPVEEHI
jgi:hypothetical protein